MKLQQNDVNECNFLKQQVNTLVQEKITVQQDAIGLDTRIHTIENDVGYEWVLLSWNLVPWKQYVSALMRQLQILL